MAIVLTILKILLIIILSILGLVVLIVLLLLLCPFRYKIAGECTDIITAGVAVRWLIAKVLLDYEKDKGLNYVVKVLGIPVYKGNVPIGSSDQEEDVGTSEESFSEEEEETAVSEEPKESAETAESEEIPEEKPEEKPGEEASDNTEASSEAEGTSDSGAESSDTEGDTSEAEKEDDRTLGEKISDSIDNLSKKIEDFQKKKDEILTRLGHVYEFLQEDYVQNTIKRVFKNIKRFLKSSRPRKGEGYINIGLKSAYDTGNLMAMIAPYYPMYSNWISVNPYFNEQKLEGRLSIKGRVFLCVMAFPMIGMLFTPDLWKTIKHARRL